ncbi:hypothetical protein LS684_19065 [Cytobacillus spongiae]|jgi:hypothetical protein|uniref:hypothetical protein n=1 Tax=Cytobacillus spongiae TaxID=2901381 RepID=UPI001F372DB8|nr:hypothetical protein [Cytobacillus spongiae]UII57998.1 hypothetical protein LS684_19065 [Cytobacillus spongiae]
MDEQVQSFELLLESLIKMLGKSNQKMDDLSKRVCQLEFLLLHASNNEYSFITHPEHPKRKTIKLFSN